MRSATYEELNELCRGIRKSFVHLETRDTYGTEVELPHMAKWRRGEPDDFGWLGWWLEMLRPGSPCRYPSRWATVNTTRRPARRQAPACAPNRRAQEPATALGQAVTTSPICETPQSDLDPQPMLPR
jgi:hypothetical protein